MRRIGCASRVFLLASLALLLAPPVARAAKEVPFLGARVNDVAGIVPPPVRDRLEAKLADLEQRTGTQVAVLTVDSLEGDSIEDYAVRVFQTWKLGRKGVDDGVLFVVARQERRMRIEVGYGLESRLTDARSRQILDDVVRPHFRAGNFGAGIEAGSDAIVAAIEGAPLPAASRAPAWQIGSAVGILLAGVMFVIVIGTFSMVALGAPGAAGWFLYLFLTPFYAIFPSIVLPRYGGLIVAGSWLAAVPDPPRRPAQPGRQEIPRETRLGHGPRLGRRRRALDRRRLVLRRWRRGWRRLLGGWRILGRRRCLQQLVGRRREAGPRFPAHPSALASPLARGSVHGTTCARPFRGELVVSGFRHRIARRRRPLARRRILHGCLLCRARFMSPRRGSRVPRHFE